MIDLKSIINRRFVKRILGDLKKHIENVFKGMALLPKWFYFFVFSKYFTTTYLIISVFQAVVFTQWQEGYLWYVQTTHLCKTAIRSSNYAYTPN